MEQLLAVFDGIEEQAEIKNNTINNESILKNCIFFIKKVNQQHN